MSATEKANAFEIIAVVAGSDITAKSRPPKAIFSPTTVRLSSDVLPSHDP